jgi:periplasmic protein TonB
MKTMVLFSLALLGVTNLYSQDMPADTTGENRIYTKVDQKPEFPGDYNKYLSENIERYPEDARDSITYGRVYISFIIEKDGSVSNIKSLYNEGNVPLVRVTMKAIANMPKWKPGMQNGKPGRVQFMINREFCTAR